MVALVLGRICFYYFITSSSNLYRCKINEWYKGFYDLLQKAPERELSEFYDGIALFMKLAIPYVIIYTITNYFTRLWAFRWREAMTFSYMPYWRAVDAKVEGCITTYSRRCDEFC